MTIQFIREYIKANPIGDKKVAIVTHGMFCRCLSAAGIQGENLVDAKDMKNCAIFPCKNIKI